MLESGSRLGNYQIEALLGQGGMGVVYEAVQLSLSRRVALKVIAPELSRNERFQERFRREGRSQAALDHPNVVTVHDFGEAEGQLYISMQLIRGPSLKELIGRGELDLGRVIRLLRPIADALDSAHEDGMVHRDFKPQNILIGSRDHAYLADFGLTQAYGEPGLTRTGQFVGTLDYIAPEQIHGKPATRRSDVYSFGAVLFECLTGRPPYPRESDAATLFAHVSEPLPRVSELRPNAPHTIDDVLAHALAKNPDERLPTATAVMDELDAAIGSAELEAAPPIDGPIQTGSTGEPQRRAATTGFGTAAPPNHGATVVDRPPTRSKVGPRPKPPVDRRPMWVSLATIFVALAAAAGAVLGLTKDDKPAGPTPAEAAHQRFVQALDGVMKPALTRAATLRRSTKAATTPQDQQQAFSAVAELYRETGARVRTLEAPSADRPLQARLIATLASVRDAYTAKVAALGSNDATAFDTATDRAAAAEQDIGPQLQAIYRSNR